MSPLTANKPLMFRMKTRLAIRVSRFRVWVGVKTERGNVLNLLAPPLLPEGRDRLQICYLLNDKGFRVQMDAKGATRRLLKT